MRIMMNLVQFPFRKSKKFQETQTYKLEIFKYATNYVAMWHSIRNFQICDLLRRDVALN